MKHALFIALHCPPESSGSGVLWALKISRHWLTLNSPERWLELFEKLQIRRLSQASPLLAGCLCHAYALRSQHHTTGGAA